MSDGLLGGASGPVVSKRTSHLLRQCLLVVLFLLLCSLPLTLCTPSIQLSRTALWLVHVLCTAGVCLSLSLRARHHRTAVHLSTLCLLVFLGTHLLNTGLRYSGAVLLMLVAPILLLGLLHRRRGVAVATLLALGAVALAAGLEFLQAPKLLAPQSAELTQFGQMLLVRSAYATLALLGISFLVDRFLAMLAEREALLGAVLGGVDSLLMVYDVDAKGDLYVAAMNPALADLMNTPVSRLVGRPRDEILPALAENAHLSPSALTVARTKQVARAESLIRIGGSAREHWMVVAPQLDERGEVQRVVVSGIDISGHRQAERQLRFQSDVLACISDAVLVVDGSGMLTYLNKAAERLYRWPAARAIGTTLAELAGEDFQRAILQSVDRSGGAIAVASGQFCRPGSAPVPVEYTVSALRGEGGEAIGTLAVIRDVTERRALQAQLLQSQKQEALGRLAGGVAHDFNNLLVVIRGSAEFVRTDLPPEHPSQPDLLEVMRAADRAAGLVRQLLAFARRQAASPRSVQLDKVLQDLTYMLRRLVREEIQLLVDVGQELWSVEVDVVQIEQVIVNLLVNARDAIPAAGRITLETRNVQLTPLQASALGVEPGDYVRLRVRDSGTGIDAETMKHIFEPFFSTKTTGAGTGLGLAVCYGIVTQLGGGIVADSTPGQGAEFTIVLPRSHAPEGGIAAAPQNDELPGGTETILVVEDEQAVRDLAVRVLRTQGYKVYEAADGATALLRAAELAQEPIDLLFTDVILPRMRGQELAERLSESRPGLGVLLASGYGDGGSSVVAAADGVWAFLAKPYGPAALLQRVRAVLDASKRARTAAPT